LGSWTSIEEMADVLKARQEGGVASAGEMLAVDSSGCIADAPGKLIALLGVKNLIVVEAGGVLLVADKRRAQDIKIVVDRVKKSRPELA
jgi:mannose-1-phosphate guanylyltransferase